MGVPIVTVIFLATLLAPPRGAQEAEEYQVKAAFLYNFAKFVEWPAQAFKSPQDPDCDLRIGHAIRLATPWNRRSMASRWKAVPSTCAR